MALLCKNLTLEQGSRRKGGDTLKKIVRTVIDPSGETVILACKPYIKTQI